MNVIRRIPIIALAPVLVVISLGSWAYASPVGSSPDDDFHLASIWCAEGARGDFCQAGPSASERYIPEAVRQAACYARHPAVSAACQLPFFAEPLRADTLTERGSFANNYPPLFYATMGLLVVPDVETAALLMRFLNIALFVGLVTVTFLLLPRYRRPSLVWGWTLTTVPLGLFLIASNNPSSWAVIAIGSVWISLLGYLETSGRRKLGLAIIFVLSVIMAGGARADAALYAIASMGVVLILTARRDRRYLIDAILPVAMAVVSVLFFFISQQSAVAVEGLPSENGPGAPGGDGLLSLIAFNLLNVPDLWAGVFGAWALGWFDTAMPAIVVLGATVAFVGVTFLGVSRVWVRKVVSIVLLVIAIWLIPTYVLVRGGQHVGDTVQPRYILPLMVVLAGVALLARRGHSVRFTGVQLAVVAIALSVANAVAMHFNIRRYVTGIDNQGLNLDNGREWWWQVPFTPMFVWGVGSIAFAVLMVVIAIWTRDNVVAEKELA